jgi:hypothetical protein
MRTKIILIFLFIVVISVGGYMLLRTPTLSKIYDSSARYQQYIGDNTLLLIDTGWNIKKIDTRSSDVHDFGHVERESYNYKFSPTGDYVSYIYEDKLYIKSLHDSSNQITAIPAHIYTWQSDNVITFIDISNQKADSTFYNEGVISTFDVETQEQKTIGNNTTAATSLHALSDTTGILTIAFGEGGENSAAIARYDLADGSTEILSSEVVLDTIYYSYGDFSYKDSSSNLVTYFGEASQQEEVKTPENYTDAYALVDGEYIIAEARSANREIVLNNIANQTEKTLFMINKIGNIQSLSYADDQLIIQTADAIYGGRINNL